MLTADTRHELARVPVTIRTVATRTQLGVQITPTTSKMIRKFILSWDKFLRKILEYTNVSICP